MQSSHGSFQWDTGLEMCLGHSGLDAVFDLGFLL